MGHVEIFRLGFAPTVYLSFISDRIRNFAKKCALRKLENVFLYLKYKKY